MAEEAPGGSEGIAFESGRLLLLFSLRLSFKQTSLPDGKKTNRRKGTAGTQKQQADRKE